MASKYQTCKGIIEYAKSLGLKAEAEIRGSGHYGLKLEAPDGRKTTMFMSQSPSCKFVMTKNKAFVRRFLAAQQTEGASS